MTIWELLHCNRKKTKTYERRQDDTQAVHEKKNNNTVNKPWFSFFLFFFTFLHLPTTFCLPQGSLIKTNAIVNYHCYTGDHRTVGSYFSFSLVWWCDFVFFRNRFVSNGSVYLSSPLSSSLYSPCERVLLAALSHYPESADFREAPNSSGSL